MSFWAKFLLWIVCFPIALVAGYIVAVALSALSGQDWLLRFPAFLIILAVLQGLAGYFLFRKDPRRSCVLLFGGVVIMGWVGAIVFAERKRTMYGTWLDLFEGSTFFESQTLAQACGAGFHDGSWFAFYPSDNSAIGRLVRQNRNSGRFVSQHGSWPVAAYKIKFVGRRRVSELSGLAPLLGFGYGHLSSFGSKIEVQRVISIEPIAEVHCDVR